MTVLPAFEQAGQSFCVPSMALILLVQVQSRVFTVKCSESQVSISNGMDAYSARTAHPFQRNGAPFRFKLSKAQQVD